MNTALIFGGKSAEHTVSLRSAKNIYNAIDKEKFTPILIGISKKGEWFLFNSIPEGEIKDNGNKLTVIPGDGDSFLKLENEKIKVAIAFPILHGPNGEDGTIQGLFKMANIPFVGPSVLGSAVAMDKAISKRLLRENGVKIVDYLVLRSNSNAKEKIEEKFNYPVFVKPANLGSSIGVSKIKSKEALKEALKEAFSYDRKVIVERAIDGKELECSVLGNENPEASRVGEIVSKDFYTYEEKYNDDSQTELKIPAEINEELEKKIKCQAVKAFKALNCEGMARVDFLVENGDIYVNELNTIPGFTEISMYPKLWNISGIEYKELITKLLDLAIERFNREKDLKVSY